MRFMKPVAAAMALTIGAMSFASTAEARHRHRHDPGAAAVAGIIGLAAGAILGSTLSQPRYYDYRAPARVYYGPPQPWTPAWYRYCDARYRSFDPATGLFLGFDGRYHFCR